MWLEVSIQVNGDQSESVAEIIRRHITSGVVIESGEIIDDEYHGHPSDWVILRGYLPVDNNLATTRANLLQDLHYLQLISPFPDPNFQEIPDQDWNQTWKAIYQPVTVGEKFIIIPAWIEMDDHPRTAILIDPGMAFGTGAHPTTRLCIEALEDYLHPGDAFVDLGCGSCILSIAAAKLDAGPIVSIDNDAQAIDTARTNVAHNQLQHQIQPLIGSLPELLEIIQGEFKPRVVVVNILAKIIERFLAEGLAHSVIPGGLLILSGILDKQVNTILEQARTLGLQEIRRYQEKDWICLVLQK